MTSMRIIKVWLGGGMVTVKAAPTPTPGLFINEDPRVRDSWNITHLASGCAVVLRLDNPEQALDLAVRLGPVCDWTVSAKALLAELPAIRRFWRSVLRDAGVLGSQPEDNSAPRAMVAGMEPLS